MKPIKKAVATVGKYTDSQGQEKTRYHTIGKLMQRDDGSHCLKIDSLPVGGDWSGWVSFYDLDDQRQGYQKQGQADHAAAAAGDQDIPF
jgi:hypothetical protein